MAASRIIDYGCLFCLFLSAWTLHIIRLLGFFIPFLKREFLISLLFNARAESGQSDQNWPLFLLTLLVVREEEIDLRLV